PRTTPGSATPTLSARSSSLAYYLTCSEDSSEGDYDPTRECFMVQLVDGQEDNAPGDDGNGGVDAQANQPVVPAAAPSSSSSSAARQAQLAQLKELQAKLYEQHRQTQELDRKS